MFQNDYFMLMIDNLSRAIAKVFFQKTSSSIELFNEQGSISADGFLYHQLKALMNEGQINEAENILFEEIETNMTAETLHVAIQFYQDLQALSDEALLASDFSRQEIIEGLEQVEKLVSINQ